jgi:protein-S-isoprenylcysteine O-methyltransferase Ste14
MIHPDADSPRVKFPPPLILLGAVLLAYAIDRVAPVPLGLGSAGMPIGAGLFVLAVAVVIWCRTRFSRAETNIRPWQPTTALITGGIYGFTRNPIYLSFVTASIGVALMRDSAWGLVTTAVLASILRYAVISREERYLEGKFGQEYRDYCKRVRRWL